MCIRDSLNTVTNIHIQPENMQSIELDKMVFSNLELRKFSMDIIRKKSEKNPIREKENLQLSIQVNNVYVMSDYIFPVSYTHLDVYKRQIITSSKKKN